MSVQTLTRPQQATEVLPPLQSGDRLDRAEFERRYSLYPNMEAELIEGVVYVASPLRARNHGEPHAHIITWLGVYMEQTPKVRIFDNTTLRIDEFSEPQPDAILRLEDGQSHIDEDDYLEGVPELVVEVAASSASYDLHDKRDLYARIGVQEYIVVQMYEERVDWFVLREGTYEPLAADEQGRLRSEMFPGLWLKPEAVFAGDMAALLATVREGLASAAHGRFVERLRGEA